MHVKKQGTVGLPLLLMALASGMLHVTVQAITGFLTLVITPA
jgi:hypothetical protein